MQVRDEYGLQFERVDAVAEQLLLGALARIDQKVLLVEVHRLPRWVTAGRGFGRGAAQYGYREAHRPSRKRSQSMAAMQPDPAAVMA